MSRARFALLLVLGLLAALLPIAMAGPVLGAPTVLINEVDADTPGDDALEFIELYDGGVGHQLNHRIVEDRLCFWILSGSRQE